MALTLSIAITQNSQSVTNNTSNVTVKVNASWTYGSFNQLQKSGYLIIDGTKYTFTSSVNYNGTTSGSQTLFTKTVDVGHNTDGTKTLACSAWYNCNLSSATNVTASASKELTTIPRKSTLSVGNGTLDTAQTLTVARQSSSFTHTITATCGSASTTICTKSSSTSISFTPPISWASQNTTGTTVSVKYTITTYNGSTDIGSNSYTKTCTIPNSVIPTCSIAVSDATGYATTYGNYIKGLSKVKVTLTLRPAYSSEINSCKTVIDGVTYTASSFTTDVLSNYGTLTIRATVTDERGRSGTTTTTISVLNYTKPNISSLTVHRCNADGTANDQGDYVSVGFSATADSLGGNTKASVTYTLSYKKTTENTWTSVPNVSDALKNNFSVTNIVRTFQADSSSSYNVKLEVDDGLTSPPVSRIVNASTGYTIMHWSSDGKRMGIGKIAEEVDGHQNLLDIGMEVRLSGGILYQTLPANTDLNDCMIPGFYVGENVNKYYYVNCPLTSGTFTLEVMSAGPNGQIRQRLTLCDKTISTTYERFYYNGAWPTNESGECEWVRTSDFGGVLLWQDVRYMSGSHTATLAEPISKQNNGIVLVFSRYSSNTAQNYHFNHAFVHKMFVKMHPGAGSTFLMTTDGTFSVMAAKYLYIHDDRIVGNDINQETGMGASGIEYENNGFVLRYVIGV